jgi:hypothetical protein
MTVGVASYEAVLNEIPGLTASEDLSTYQFCFVKLSGDNTVAHAAHTERAIGILQNNPASGSAATVAGIGSVSKLKVAAAGTVTYGQMVAPDNTSPANLGRAIVATTGDYPVATVLYGGAAADLVPVLFHGADRVI